MREAMFIPDDVSSRPPAGDVGMGWIGNENLAEAAVGSLFRVEFQFIHALEIEGNAAAAAIDLETVIVLAPGGEAGRFDGTYCPTIKLHECECRIVYVHRRHRGAARCHRSLANKGLEQTGNFRNFTYQIA